MARRKHVITAEIEREMPQRMLHMAMAFTEAGERCFSGTILGTPAVVNYVFSVELYLKLLHLTTKDPKEEMAWGHDIFDIYNKLNPSTKDKITGNTRWAGDPDWVPGILKQDAEAFEKWRYAYEHAFLSTGRDDLLHVIRALHETVKEVAPPTLRVPEKVGISAAH